MNEPETTAVERYRVRLEAYGLRRMGLYAILLGLVAFYMTPIESGIVTSLKTGHAIVATEPYAPPSPEGFTTGKWETAFDVLARGMINSLVFSIPATVIGAVIGSLTAYGITKADWRGQSLVLALLVAGIFIPYQSVLVPLSRFWSVHLRLAELLAPLWRLPFLVPEHAALVELTVTHIAYGIPLTTILFRAHYQTIPDELVEAAKLDGASFTRIYRKIILPLSTPMFAVVLIFQFTQIWNDLLFALILVSSESSPVAPATLILAGLGEALEGLDFALRMAGAFITALPPLIVYVLFGEQFAEGVAT